MCVRFRHYIDRHWLMTLLILLYLFIILYFYFFNFYFYFFLKKTKKFFLMFISSLISGRCDLSTTYRQQCPRDSTYSIDIRSLNCLIYTQVDMWANNSLNQTGYLAIHTYIYKSAYHLAIKSFALLTSQPILT